MDCIVNGVTKSRTQLSAFHFTSGGLGKAKGGYHIHKGPQSICGIWSGLNLEDTSKRENRRKGNAKGLNV